MGWKEEVPNVCTRVLPLFEISNYLILDIFYGVRGIFINNYIANI